MSKDIVTAVGTGCKYSWDKSYGFLLMRLRLTVMSAFLTQGYLAKEESLESLRSALASSKIGG